MIETRPNEYKAYFTIIGDFNPTTITEQLGVEPTRAWKKGERNEKTLLERKFSRWSLDSRLDEFQSLEAHIADVLAQLEMNVESFQAAGKAHGGGGMQLVGYFYQSYPGLHLEPDLIAKLALFNLSVDCDFYYLYSDAREDS